MNTVEALAWLGTHAEELASLAPDLQRLGDLTKVEQERTHNIQRLGLEERRLIESHKAQARAELEGEAAVIREKAIEDAAKLMVDRQRDLDMVDAEIRIKQRRLNEILGDIERGEKKLAEYHRIRQNLLAG